MPHGIPFNSKLSLSATSFFLALSLGLVLPVSTLAAEQGSAGGAGEIKGMAPATNSGAQNANGAPVQKSALSKARTNSPTAIAAKPASKKKAPATKFDPATADSLPPDTVTAPSSDSVDSLPSPDSLGPLTPPPLPPEPTVNHSQNKTMDIGPMNYGPLIQIASLRPMRLEASYNEPFNLRDALTYAMRNNLPIKISRETWNSQRYLFRASLGGFLPNFSLGYNLTHTRIFPHRTVDNRQFSTSISQPVFQGGRVLYGALAQYYRQNGWNYSYRGTINDTLLDVYQKYTNLLLNRALLQIRIKAVETSEAQLKLNEQLYSAGTGTRFAVMQSRTQLAQDRQLLLVQQVTVRQSALALAFSLNMPLAINLVPQETSVTEYSLVDESLNINDLLNVSVVRRPELRQYEFFRLAAARNVQVQSAQYYPTVTLFTSYNRNDSTISGNGSGFGSASNGASSLTGQNGASGTGGFSSPAGTVATPTASTSIVSGNQGVNNSSTTANVPQSGALVGGASTGTATTGFSQSGLSSPGGASANPGSFGSSQTGSNSNSALIAGGGSTGLTNSLALGMQMNWSLPGLGYTTSQNILSSRALARQALLQANQQLLLVTQQVRSSYLNALTAREQIDVTASGVASSGEALRLANLRVQTGVGTNLELIQAQRDYITALVNQAQAIIASNQAQAQLLHDTGVISVDTLTAGYKIRMGANSLDSNL